MFACFLLPVFLLFFGCSQSFSLNLGGRDKWYCKVMSFRKVSSNEYREHLSLKFQLMKWVMWGIKRRWPWHIFALMSSVRQKYFFGQINCNELLVYLHYQRYGLRKLRVHYPVWYGLDGILFLSRQMNRLLTCHSYDRILACNSHRYSRYRPKNRKKDRII